MYFYSNTLTDAPQLNNTWGDFNKVINYLLDGGTDQTVVSASMTEVDKVNIQLVDVFNLIPFCTIRITGSSIGYNGDYFVESYDANTKIAILYKSNLAILPTDNSDTLKFKIRPSGLIKRFGGITEQRTIFETRNGVQFRVDDRDYSPLVNPPVTFNEIWQKVCRVCMSDNFSGLDNGASQLHPYNAERPTENFYPVNNYIGQAYFIYNQNPTTLVDQNPSSISLIDYLTPTAASTIKTRGPMNWAAWANDTGIIIVVKPKNLQVSYHYAMLEVDNKKIGYLNAHYNKNQGYDYQPASAFANYNTAINQYYYGYNSIDDVVYNTCYPTLCGLPASMNGTSSFPPIMSAAHKPAIKIVADFTNAYYSYNAVESPSILSNNYTNAPGYIQQSGNNITTNYNGNVLISNCLIYSPDSNWATTLSTTLLLNKNYYGQLEYVKWINNMSNIAPEQGQLTKINNKYYMTSVFYKHRTNLANKYLVELTR